MFRKGLPVAMAVMGTLLAGCGAKDNIAPKIIATNPQNGAQDVDPSTRLISITFDEPMMDKSWSWCRQDEGEFPQTTGQPFYTDEETRNVLPVQLQPNTEYVIWINTE